LTIKFTRHTAAPLRSTLPHCHPERSIRFAKRTDAKSRDLEFDLISAKTTTRRANSMGLDPAHRTQHRSSLCEPSRPLWLTLFAKPPRTLQSKRNPRRVHQQILSGTHKNLHAL